MRVLDTSTLKIAAEHYAVSFMRPDKQNAIGRYIDGPSYVTQDFYRFNYKDEFDFMVENIRGNLGVLQIAKFDDLAAETFKPRSVEVFKQILSDKLAVDIEGNHIPGKVGTVQLGNRTVGFRRKTIVTKRGNLDIPKNVYWPIYAGETEERVAGNDNLDPLPIHTQPMPAGANNTRISNEVALLMCDAAVDNLDEGAGAAVIQGRSGAQPADPDTAVTGTLLFTLTCSDPAFGAAADAAPGGTATASAVTDDASADATATLGYCRASSTADGATPVDDHLDGEAGTSGADFNFNTLAIVSGATISLTSWTVTQPES